jgi:micrococcal nuclease
MRVICVLIFLILCTIATIAWAGEKHKVVRVVDGDTIVLEKLGAVRLASLDTPESDKHPDPRKKNQCYGKEASEYLTKRLLGQYVRIKYGEEKTGVYDRPLVYVKLGRKSINIELIKNGYAYTYPSKDYKTVVRYMRYERHARSRKLGLWGACYK